MKRKAHLNVVDLTLLLLLVLCLLSTLFRFRMLRNDGADEELAEYFVVVRLEDLDAALADSLLAGERARLPDEEGEATIASTRVTDANVMLIFGGVQYEATWDRGYRCDLLVTLSVRAREAGGVLYLGGRYAKAMGDSLTICTDRTKMTGIIVSFSPAKSPALSYFVDPTVQNV